MQHPPRLVLVTPSHQYPLGMVMSLARRRMLLEYARQHRCWIIEDDYDSEFLLRQPPARIAAARRRRPRDLRRQPRQDAVPGLRMGYMVVPEHLVDTFRTGLSGCTARAS